MLSASRCPSAGFPARRCYGTMAGEIQTLEAHQTVSAELTIQRGAQGRRAVHKDGLSSLARGPFVGAEGPDTQGEVGPLSRKAGT